METAHRATGDGDEKAREYRLAAQKPLRLTYIAKPVPKLRKRRPSDKQADHQSQSHKNQRESENRIYPSDDLVDRHQRGKKIIKEYHPDPYHNRYAASIPRDVSENERRAEHEHRSHKHQHNDGERQNESLCAFPEIFPDQVRQSRSPVPYGEHSGHIVVHRSGENAAQNNPQVG